MIDRSNDLKNGSAGPVFYCIIISMNEKKHFWTLRYTLINVTYFAVFCTVHAYAAVYLLDRGFTNTQIGILLAVANVASAFLQPVVASLIDRQGIATNRNVCMCCAAIIAVGSALLLVADHNRIVVFVVYALIYMVQFTYMPVMTALNFEYTKAGANIFYGLARGLGSAGFAITSAIIGKVIEMRGVRVLLYVNIAIMLIQVVIIYFFRLPKDQNGSLEKSSGQASDQSAETTNERPDGMLQFLRRYPSFTIMLLATILLFFTHNMLNDYLIQIIRPLGGSESHLGIATFLAALLELPTMAVISLISKKVSMRILLIISGISFTVKVVIMLIASSIPLVYASQAIQMFAYAVYIPAAAYYVSDNIASTDQVKGQAFVTSTFTLAGVFSSLICGIILDKLGVRHMLVIGTIISIAGTALIVYAMCRRDETVKEQGV